MNASPPASNADRFGQALYDKISAIAPTEAPKVTGMILEMSADQIAQMLSDDALLQSKVKEAMDVLAANK